MKALTLSVLAAMAIPTAAFSQTPAPPPQWFPIPSNAVFETGDAWTVGETRYRLYGVQACLRGSTFTNAVGVKRDCGETGLAVLVSLIRDLKPQCYQAASRPDLKTAFVFCFATIAEGAAAGSRIDLGTAIISMGYAFASIKPDNQPVHMPYYVAQLVARQAKRGLWAFADVPDPNVTILRAYNAQAPAAQGHGGAVAAVPAPVSPAGQ